MTVPSSLTTCLLLLAIWVLPAAAEPLVIAAVGDIMLGGRYDGVISREGEDYPFAPTTGHLKRAHLAIGNLEAPLTSRGTEYRDKRFRFRARPGLAAPLRRAGFGVLTLANNHLMDYGPVGLTDTLDALTSEGIETAGAGANISRARSPARVTRAERRVAVLAYSLTQPTAFFATAKRAGTAPAHHAQIEADIRRARQQADLVIVSLHWGGELETAPRQVQRDLARRAIDAGASVILGHHPHVLQGIEQYGGGLICYSLGNFTFGSGSRAATESMIAMITIPDAGPPELEIIPLTVDNRATRYQPRPLAGSAAATVIARLDRLSRPLGSRIVADGASFRAVPERSIHAASLYRHTAAR